MEFGIVGLLEMADAPRSIAQLRGSKLRTLLAVLLLHAYLPWGSSIAHLGSMTKSIPKSQDGKLRKGIIIAANNDGRACRRALD